MFKEDKNVEAQLERNAEENLPSITQKRGPVDEESEEKGLTESTTSTTGNISDLEYREFCPPKPQGETELQTMENERESMVEEEAKWVKEHHMEPDEGELEEKVPRETSPDIPSEATRQHRGSSTDRDEYLSQPSEG